VEGDDRVVLRGERGLDHLEERLRALLPVDDHLAAEEPVARVLGVGLAHVEELHVRGVPAQLLLEQRRVVVQVPVVEPQAFRAVQLLQHGAALLQHRDHLHGLGAGPGGEGAQRLRVGHLRHPVVHRGQERAALRRRQRRARLEQVPARALEPGHGQPAALADGDRVRAPGRAEVQPRAHLQHLAPISGAQKRSTPSFLRLKSFSQKPL